MWLAIETALDACSAALIEDDRVVAHRHERLGRGHAERLVPLVAELLDAVPAGNGLSRILVDVGPGSFTGLRIGIAAARAFGLAWAVPVHGTSALAIVAAASAAPDRSETLVVAVGAGRGNSYVQCFEHRPGGPLRASGSPETLPTDAVPAYARAHSGRLVADRQPDARDMRLLDPPWRLLPLAPVYLRAPAAKVAA